ncbi:hypothetical protein ZWY2020_011681 [Hordeum vulgare]|nr:hypothetical protein ZWY2020_011681 [Hordeum vulgare]
MDPPRLPLAGVLIKFQDREFTELLHAPSRPRPRSPPTSTLPAQRRLRRAHQDHCNGLLLLLGGYVVSPTTRQWVVLPPRPPRRNAKELLFRHYDYIVFDPAVSPHSVLVRPGGSLGDREHGRGARWRRPIHAAGFTPRG